MRRIIAPLALLVTLLLLSGCGGGTIYSNYKDIASLELIRTIGVDLGEDGLVSVVSGTGVGAEKASPKIYGETAESLGAAVSALRRISTGGSVYFSHTEHIVIGEDMARSSFAALLDYVERATEMRMDTNVFVTRDVKAGEVVTGTAGEDSSASDMLEALRRDVTDTGEGYVTTCGEIASAMADTGIALVSAVSLAESGKLSGDGERMVIPRGFAVIQDGKLKFYVPEDAARGVTIIKNKMKYATATIEDESGEKATLGITRAKTSIEPVFTDGALERLEVKIKLEASVIQAYTGLDLNSDDARRRLAEKAAEHELDGVSKAIKLSQKSGVDFMDFGGTIERRDPVKLSKVEGGWDAVFPGLPIFIRIDVNVGRTYDIDRPLSVTGGGFDGTKG